MAKNLPAMKSPQDALQVAFKQDLANITPYLESLLGKGRVGRFQRMAQLAVLRDPNLLQATKKSLLLSILWCAQKNLEPGVEDGAWLIPFKVKGVLTVTPIPGYKGLVTRAVEVGAALSVDPVAVYEHDDFYYCFGLEPDLRHTPPKLGDDRGDLIGAYVTITLPNGEKKFKVMDRQQIEKHRNAGAAWRNAPDSGPWKDWEEAMFLKTVIKQGLKTVPMASELRDLLSEDGMIETGASVAALAEAAANEAGKELPDDLKGGDEDLSAAQDKVAKEKVDTSKFDALVAAELKDLSPGEAQTRLIHLEEDLKVVAKANGKKIPEFKAYVAEGGFFHPYKNAKEEDRPGYWQTFLGKEAAQYPPAEKAAMTDPGEAKGAFQDPLTAAEAAQAGEPQPFEDRHKALAMEILKHPIPMADLEIAGLSEITPENIGDIETRVKNWVPPKKK
jgi:phage RecT family recombinase